MDIEIVEIHAAESSKALNTEWFVVENTGESPFSTKNCTLSVTRGKGKPRGSLGTLDPGFTLAPGEKMRVCTGNPGKKAHGKPPEDEIANYFLFLGQTVLRGPGTVLVFSLRSHELARATYDPEVESGVAAAEDS